MEGLKRALFEDPLYLYIALGFVELVLAVVWHETRSRRRLAMLAIPPLLAAGVWGTSRWVVTDREQILAATEAIARDAEAGSVAAAEEYLDEDYRGYGRTKAGVLAIGRTVLETYPLERVGFTRQELAVERDNATMHAATIITLANGSKAAVAFDVQWIKRPAGWRIIDLSEPQQRLEL